MKMEWLKIGFPRTNRDFTSAARLDLDRRRVGQRLHLLSRQDMYPYRWLQVTAEIQALLPQNVDHEAIQPR